MASSLILCYMMAARLFEGSNAATGLYNLRMKQHQIYNPYGFKKRLGGLERGTKKNHNSDVEKKNKKFNFLKSDDLWMFDYWALYMGLVIISFQITSQV